MASRGAKALAKTCSLCIYIYIYMCIFYVYKNTFSYTYEHISLHAYIHMYEHDLLDVCTTQEERDVRACLAPHESKERRRASQSPTTRHRKTQSATECHRTMKCMIHTARPVFVRHGAMLLWVLLQHPSCVGVGAWVFRVGVLVYLLVHRVPLLHVYIRTYIHAQTYAHALCHPAYARLVFENTYMYICIYICIIILLLLLLLPNRIYIHCIR